MNYLRRFSSTNFKYLNTVPSRKLTIRTSYGTAARFMPLSKYFNSGYIPQFSIKVVKFLSTQPIKDLDDVTFEKISDETLESLSDYFEELIENNSSLEAADVAYSSGVLTINLGAKYGTYVINRQSPNKQVWLSSPFSGPKRYDFDGNKWVYKHDDKSLHALLQEEMSKIVKNVDFSQCSYSR